MTKTDQQRIADELLTSLRDSMLSRLEHAPPEWDGVELRELMADIAREYFADRPLTPGRLRAYRNARATLNI